MSCALSGEVVADTSQVWDFLAASASVPGDFPTVSVCFDITFYFECALGFDMLPKAKWKIW